MYPDESVLMFTVACPALPSSKLVFSLANKLPHYPLYSDDIGLELISMPRISMPDDEEKLLLGS